MVHVAKCFATCHSATREKISKAACTIAGITACKTSPVSRSELSKTDASGFPPSPSLTALNALDGNCFPHTLVCSFTSKPCSLRIALIQASCRSGSFSLGGHRWKVTLSRPLRLWQQGTQQNFTMLQTQTTLFSLFKKKKLLSPKKKREKACDATGKSCPKDKPTPWTNEKHCLMHWNSIETRPAGCSQAAI